MAILLSVVLLIQIVTLQTSDRKERLVLHSDEDVLQELAKLKAEMAALNISYRTDIEHLKIKQTNEIQNLNNSHRTDMENLKAAHIAEISALNHTLETMEQAHKTDVMNLMSQTSATFREHGSTYIRWGRTTCGGGNGTQLIYKGYTAGSAYDEDGNGANQQCLPDDPTWGHYDDASQSHRGRIYGTEFEVFESQFFSKPIGNEDVPCAVCYVPGTSLMIPARTNCYPGWTVEYTGYLMTSRYGRARPSDYVCVDGDPEFIPRGAPDTDGHLLYLVEGICGTLVCPPYFNYREMACSVCSKKA